MIVAIRPWLHVLVLATAACASPEAARIRGGRGADIGNRHEPVEMYGGAEPYHGTPCVTKPVKCTGPLPVFGPTQPRN